MTNNAPSIPAQRRMCLEPALVGKATLVTTELMAWELFITQDIIDKIVTHTNEKIQSILTVFSLSDNPKIPPHIKLTDCVEIKSFFGLLYGRGLQGQNNYCYKQLFTEGMGHPIFGAVMSMKRFGFLHANITFDDTETRHQRWQAEWLVSATILNAW